MAHDHHIELGIAIVGMAGRFPGAPSVDALWRLLDEGREGIRDLTDEELRAAGTGGLLDDPRLVRRAADLADADLFDAGLFGFTPREAEITDPQFRVFLEDAWTALEDAGRHGTSARERTGVFAGGSPETYYLNNVLANGGAARAVGDLQASLGNQRDYLATQVSYRLDLRGPSLTVQTACSTSLVAVHLACQSLLARESDLALAGGVSVSVPQTAGYVYEEGGIASPDGRCRAFDAGAAGCLRGNGSGVVVLRRLEDALRDGDRIRAVILGSAMNNDGSAKVGFTAPSEEGQAAVIHEALGAAGLSAEAISYVEAHGTATALGDPIEIAALARAFAQAAEAGDRQAGGAARSSHSERCAIGSIKTNIGHLDAAAGVAGLIKTVLMLEHRTIVPSLHFRTPNPRLELEGSPFRIAAERREWSSGGVPRRAGVSSFGIGGTNAHVVVEEAPESLTEARAWNGEDGVPALVLLSAASETALAQAAAALASRLEEKDAPALADVAFTTQTGRRRLSWRRAIVASSRAQAAAEIRAGGGRSAPVREERRGSEIAFVFPGQGAQRPGMARALYEREPLFRAAFDAAAAAMRAELELDLASVLYPKRASGDGASAPGLLDGDASATEVLRETRLAQPSLFAVEVALARLLASWGVRPAAVAGHSVGEYAAACVAGVMTLEDAASLVAARARLMSGMARGAMLATTLAEADLAARLGGFPVLALAAVNGPATSVASGPEGEIERLEAALGAEGIACKRLVVSHAFHSAMMEPALGPFEAKARAVRLRAPAIPMLSNLTGTWITAAQATDPGYWSAHLRGTVRFADNLSALAGDPARVLLELGPGAAMTALARRASPASTAIAVLPGVESEDAAEADLLNALGALWRAGADIDWNAVNAGRRARRVALPTYPFERKRYWIDAPRAGASAPADATSDARADGLAQGKDPDLSNWFYVPGWTRAAALERPAASPEPPWLVLSDGSALAGTLAELGVSRGARVITVLSGRSYARQGETFTIDPEQHDHHERLLRELKQEDARPGRIVHLWRAAPRASEDAGEHDDARAFWPLLFLLQAAGASGSASGMRLVAVANGLFDVAGETPRGPDRALLAGVCRVAMQEYPGLLARLVDASPREAGAPSDDGGAAARIVAELDAVDREAVVAWRGGHRWVPSYARSPLARREQDPEGIRPEGVYLITGGTGPLETAIAARLAASGAKAVAFGESGGSGNVAEAEGLDALRAAGTSVELAAVAAGDTHALASLVDSLRSRFGRLDAVFHTAGVIGGGMIQLKERSAASSVLGPRVAGSRALAAALREGERLVLFSSAISATGVFGQVDFCAASAYMDALAQASGRGAGPRVLAVDWGTAHWDRWSGAGGEALLAQLREMQAEVGITVDEGVEALWRALARDEAQILVSPQPLDELLAQTGASTVAELVASMGAGAAAGAARDDRAVVPVSGEIEARVAALWSDLLGIAPIGRRDNFFELGGNSLVAIQLASQLRAAFDIELTIATLFESADLAALAASVEAALAASRDAKEVARILEEIESLSEDEVRRELAESETADGRAAPPGPGAARTRESAVGGTRETRESAV